MGIINNAAQEAAIRHETGPALVLAGPGSGKTYVITNRLKYLTENLDIDASSVLTITFTNCTVIRIKFQEHPIISCRVPSRFSPKWVQ